MPYSISTGVEVTGSRIGLCKRFYPGCGVTRQHANLFAPPVHEGYVSRTKLVDTSVVVYENGRGIPQMRKNVATT